MAPQQPQNPWWMDQWHQIRGNVKWEILKAILLGAFGGAVAQVLAWLKQQSPGFWGMIGSIVLLPFAAIAMRILWPSLSESAKRCAVCSAFLSLVAWFWFVSTLSYSKPQPPLPSPSVAQLPPNSQASPAAPKSAPAATDSLNPQRSAPTESQANKSSQPSKRATSSAVGLNTDISNAEVKKEVTDLAEALDRLLESHCGTGELAERICFTPKFGDWRQGGDFWQRRRRALVLQYSKTLGQRVNNAIAKARKAGFIYDEDAQARCSIASMPDRTDPDTIRSCAIDLRNLASGIP